MVRSRRVGNIRGPQSALTDFLASNNISAVQIRADYEARRAQANPQSSNGDGDGDDEENADQQEEQPEEDKEEETDEDTLTPAQKRRRKRQQEAALAKIKKSQAFKKRKRGMEGEPGEDDDDDIAFDMYEKSRPPPGQLDHCEICEKRFTVTPYSKEGPNGGLLCGKCSKEAKDGEKAAKKAQKKPPAKRARRQVQSQLLDGLVRHGAKSLLDICVEKIANVSNDIEEFGDIGDNDQLISKLSQIFSKRRVLDSRTSKLFLRSDYKRIILHDCGMLLPDDFNYIFSVAHNVKHLYLRNAGQLKDQTIDYMLDQGIKLESFQVEGCNLINDKKWQEYFKKAGKSLKALKIAWLDFAMTDETIGVMVKHCPNLERLKIKRCFKVTEASLTHLAKLKKLEHLSLYMMSPVEEKHVNSLIKKIGGKLKTLSLERFDTVSNDTLEIIHDKCHQLKKLRVTDNDYTHDAGFEGLFTAWNNPALEFVDFTSSRDVDNQNPEGPEDPIGLADDGFKAMMQHSGLKLRKLHIPSCRHISTKTMADTFDGKKTYPRLEEIDLSLIPDVDDVVVTGIFQSCPNIKKVTVFACFGVKEVVVPSGVALIGTPHAQDAIVQEGTTLG